MNSAEVVIERGGNRHRRRSRVIWIVTLAVVASVPFLWLTGSIWKGGAPIAKASAGEERLPNTFRPTASQWATLSIADVQQEVFQTEVVTEGKIAVDEDRSTPVFSPFGGRIAKFREFRLPPQSSSQGSNPHRPAPQRR